MFLAKTNIDVIKKINKLPMFTVCLQFHFQGFYQTSIPFFVQKMPFKNQTQTIPTSSLPKSRAKEKALEACFTFEVEKKVPQNLHDHFGFIK